MMPMPCSLSTKASLWIAAYRHACQSSAAYTAKLPSSNAMKSQKTIYGAFLWLSFTGLCHNALAGAAGSPQISAFYTDYRQIPVEVLQQYLQRFADAPVHQ